MEAKKIWFDRENIFVETTTNQTAHMPLSWFKKLQAATLQQLEEYELWDNNRWIHWEALGEDLSIDGFFTFHKNNHENKILM